MGLHISFKHPFGKHSVLHQAGGVAKKLAPLAAFIPGVGPLAAAAIGGLGALAHHEKLGGIVQGAAGGALGGIASDTLQGGDLLSKIGKFATQPGVLGNAAGGLDLGKVAGAGMAAANVVGANQQRKQANNYNNANIDLRNQMLSRLLSGAGQQTYNFAPTS